MNIPTLKVSVPGYSVESEPDHEAVGKIVDDFIRQHFLDQTVVIRGLSSKQHDMPISSLENNIKKYGTDRYDPKRKGDRYENVDGKRIDLFGFRRKMTERTRLFRDLSWGFYHGSIAVHGQPTRLNLLLIYDAAKLKAVLHRYEGRDDKKRDGFVFIDPSKKSEALLAIIRLTN